MTLKAQIISFAKVSIGESRVKVDQNEFTIRYNKKEIKSYFIADTIQWLRNDSNLLTPRALLALAINLDESNLSINYKGKIIFPTKRPNYFYTEIYVDLFNPGTIEIYRGKELFDKIQIVSNGAANAKSKQLIDYSCAPFKLSIEGVDSEYISVGCKLESYGKSHDRRPRLEVTFSSTNLFNLKGETPPFTIYLNDSSPVFLDLVNSSGEISKIKIKAELPSKLKRLKLAGGIGPYIYKSQEYQSEIENRLTMSYMLYGKYDLTETSSLKAFDALIYSQSIFNNSGLYFSYDLAEAFDGRVLVNALLGFQGLHFRQDKTRKTTFEVLYPQGFEIMYKHAFGILNQHLTYGMFFSTTNEIYTNAWIRYGGKIFGEINYIDWKNNHQSTSMIGLSIGFPILQAL